MNESLILPLPNNLSISDTMDTLSLTQSLHQLVIRFFLWMQGHRLMRLTSTSCILATLIPTKRNTKQNGKSLHQVGISSCSSPPKRNHAMSSFRSTLEL